MTYGTLELSAQTLTIMSIVAVVLLVAATISHLAVSAGLGLLLQFLSLVLTIVLMATWFTTISSEGWSDMGPSPVIAALILGAVSIFVPPYLAGTIEDL